MKIKNGIRTAGKTHACILESARTKFPIVCMHDAEARRIVLLAKRIHIDIPTPITFDNLQDNGYLSGRRIEAVIIDNADSLLNNMFACKIHMITTSCEEF